MNSRNSLFGSLEDLTDLNLETDINHQNEINADFFGSNGEPYNSFFADSPRLNQTSDDRSLDSSTREESPVKTDEDLLSDFIQRYNDLYSASVHNQLEFQASIRNLYIEFQGINRDLLSTADCLLMWDVLEFLFLAGLDLSNPALLDRLLYLKEKYNSPVLNSVIYFDDLEVRVREKVNERQMSAEEQAELRALRMERTQLEALRKDLVGKVAAVLPQLDERLLAETRQKMRNRRKLRALLDEVTKFGVMFPFQQQLTPFLQTDDLGESESDEEGVDDFYCVYTQKRAAIQEELVRQTFLCDQIGENIVICRQEIGLHKRFLAQKNELSTIRISLPCELMQEIEAKKANIHPSRFFSKSLNAAYQAFIKAKAIHDKLQEQSERLEKSIDLQRRILEDKNNYLDKLLNEMPDIAIQEEQSQRQVVS